MSCLRVVLKLVCVPGVCLPGTEAEGRDHIHQHQPPAAPPISADTAQQDRHVDQDLRKEVRARDELKPVPVRPEVVPTSSLPLPFPSSQVGEDFVADVLMIARPEEEAECQ